MKKFLKCIKTKMKVTTFKYDIKQFRWDSKTKTFYAKENYLYPIPKGRAHNKQNTPHPFPSHGKKFKMYNPITSNERSFSLLHDKSLSWEYESDCVNKFKCVIYKTAHPLIIQYTYPDEILININEHSSYRISPESFDSTNIKIIKIDKDEIQSKTKRRRYLGSRRKFSSRFTRKGFRFRKRKVQEN